MTNKNKYIRYFEVTLNDFIDALKEYVSTETGE